MREANHEYRLQGHAPGTYVDTGTHLARFEAMTRLHWAIFSLRKFKRVANCVELGSLRYEIRQSLRLVRGAACPIIPR